MAAFSTQEILLSSLYELSLFTLTSGQNANFLSLNGSLIFELEIILKDTRPCKTKK